MNRYFRTTLLPLCFFSATASANYGLSIDAMNANINRCYEQTTLIKQNDYGKALSTVACNRVINNDWSSKKLESAMLINRGLIHRSNGNLAQAKRDFMRAAKVDPSRYEAFVSAAQLLFEEGLIADSIRYYDQALALKNDNPALQRNRDTAARLLKQTRIAKVAAMLSKNTSLVKLE